MRLDVAELSKLLAILEKIDRGQSQPRVPDRIGRFIRQYGNGRSKIDQVLAGRGVERRTDGAVSGGPLGAIESHSMLEPEVSLLGFPLGEVAQTIALSEQLGGVMNVIMWLKGPVANAAYNILRENPGLWLSGDYRWSPPARLTLGEAHLNGIEQTITWRDARCLKAVADDLTRPPHALEYVLDYRLGPPGLKYFRCVCAVKRQREWEVLPGLAGSRSLEIARGLPEILPGQNAGDLAALLIYREPWSTAWTIVAGDRIGADDVLAHAITWVDFQRELDSCEMDGEVIAGIRAALRASGLRPPEFAEANLTRALLPVARDVTRWLRGCG